MQKVKFIVNQYTTKKGVPFTKASILGKFIPSVDAIPEVRYPVSFTKKSECELPTKAGVYEVGFMDKGAWLDQRNPEKPVFRINAVRCRFDKPLVQRDAAIKVAEEAIDIANESDK